MDDDDDWAAPMWPPELTLSADDEHDVHGSVEVGDYITFGHYPQTASGTDNTPIEWLVLDVDNTNHRALVISRYGLDSQPYHSEDADITWESCSLRKWLNYDFLKAAFAAQEQEGIVLTNVDNSISQGHSDWGTNGGNSTQDKIFLLSYAEANNYFGVTWEDSNNTKSRVAPTAYAIKQGAYFSSNYKTADDKASGWWWLRSPGFYQYSAVNVIYGEFSYSSVNYPSGCVRPALWIDLNADIF